MQNAKCPKSQNVKNFILNNIDRLRHSGDVATVSVKCLLKRVHKFISPIPIIMQWPQIPTILQYRDECHALYAPL